MASQARNLLGLMALGSGDAPSRKEPGQLAPSDLGLSYERSRRICDFSGCRAGAARPGWMSLGLARPGMLKAVESTVIQSPPHPSRICP